MNHEKTSVGVKDSSASNTGGSESKKNVNLSQILRNWRKKEETLLTGNMAIDEVINALKHEPVEGIDFIVKDDSGKEIYRFYFLGPGRAPVPLGSKWGQKLVQRACPECGKQTPVMVIVKQRAQGRPMKKEATIHCGKFRYFDPRDE